jgi:hypothetical protein
MANSQALEAAARKPRLVRLAGVPLSLLVCLAAACSQKPEPLFASAADQAGYAERYPAGMAAVRTRYAEDERRARETMGKFDGYPDELASPDFNRVAEVVKRADVSGKSGDFVRGMEEAEAVQRFYDEERQPIVQKVGGSVAYAAKEKSCDAELSGPVAGALDKAVEKQLEERLRVHNDAQRYIEDNRDALGKANIEKLQKQADAIAITSYIAHVRLKQHKVELETMIGEASAVQKTLERSVSEANAVLQDPNASKAAKDVAKVRAETAQQAQAATEVEVQQAQAAVKEIENRIAQIETDYNKALEALLAKIDEKAKQAPAGK